MKKTTLPGKSARNSKKQLRLLCAAALLAALSIVLGKYLAIPLGDSVRISFENLPVLMAGVFLGPVTGCIVGVVADILGCLLVGYTINPIITVGAALIGALSGLIMAFFRKNHPRLTVPSVCLAVAVAHIMGSMIVKSIGLAVYYATPMPILLLRIPTYIVIGLLESTILCLLARNKLFTGELDRLLRNHRKGG